MVVSLEKGFDVALAHLIGGEINIHKGESIVGTIYFFHVVPVSV